MDFKPSKMLEDYVKAQPRDMYDIVGALVGYTIVDPQFKTDEFKQAIAYVLDNGVSERELFAEFDDSLAFEADPAKWTEEYYSFARVYLKDNFCKERIAHVEEVAKKVYPAPAVSKSHEQSTGQGGPHPAKKTRSQQKNRKSNATPESTKTIIVVIILLLALVVLIAILAGKNEKKNQKKTESAKANARFHVLTENWRV